MMTYHEFKKEMESYRRDAEADASARKDSQLVLDRLHRVYREFDRSEQAMANRVLAEWALSADEGVRFDALALIGEFKVSQAIPALSVLAQRLEASNAPGAPYELEKVKRLVANLPGERGEATVTAGQALEAVVTGIAAKLQAFGFARRGLVLRKIINGSAVIVEFQNSDRSSSEHILFTINLGLVRGDLLELGGGNLQKAQTPEAHLTLRLGRLLPEPSDKWWELSGSTNTDELTVELSHDLVTKAIPYLETYLSSDALIALWESGQSPGLTKVQRTHYLHALKNSGRFDPRRASHAEFRSNGACAKLNRMTLREALENVESFEDDEVVFAKRPWTADSDALIGHLGDQYGVPAHVASQAFEYFIDVPVAKEVLAVLGEGRSDARRRVALLFYYVENDAYPDWVYAGGSKSS